MIYLSYNDTETYSTPITYDLFTLCPNSKSGLRAYRRKSIQQTADLEGVNEVGEIPYRRPREINNLNSETVPVEHEVE